MINNDAKYNLDIAPKLSEKEFPENTETKYNLDIAPKLFEKEFPEKREYWSCRGEVLSSKVSEWTKGKAKVAFYTAEDAEAHAFAFSNSEWEWDGENATSSTLISMIKEARSEKRSCVRIKAYVNDKWVVVNEFPCDKPLPEHLR